MHLHQNHVTLTHPNLAFEKTSPFACSSITRIVNLSLETAVFPSSFKSALVTPLLKKPSLDSEIKKQNKTKQNKKQTKTNKQTNKNKNKTKKNKQTNKKQNKTKQNKKQKNTLPPCVKLDFCVEDNREYPLHSCVIANKRGHSRSIPHSINLINDLL